MEASKGLGEPMVGIGISTMKEDGALALRVPDRHGKNVYETLQNAYSE